MSSITKTIRTTCGKTISYKQEEGENAKMHSLEGPALIYSEKDNKPAEYYINGIRYTKAQWLELAGKLKQTQGMVPEYSTFFGD